MANSRLILHCGAREVARDELNAVPTPRGTRTWYPLPHGDVVTAVEESLTSGGFQIRGTRFGLTRNDARMFSTMTLESPLATGVSLAVGIRSSWDKSLPLGFVAGSSVFVCDNLAFRADLLVTKKHTRFGEDRFRGEIAQAVVTLDAFREHEAKRIRRLQLSELSDQQAESLMLRSYEHRLISHRILTKVIGEWRRPSFADFETRDAWSLLNAYTTALGPRAKSNPQQYAAITMRLNGLIDKAVGIEPFALPAPAAEGNGHA